MSKITMFLVLTLGGRLLSAQVLPQFGAGEHAFATETPKHHSLMSWSKEAYLSIDLEGNLFVRKTIDGTLVWKFDREQYNPQSLFFEFSGRKNVIGVASGISPDGNWIAIVPTCNNDVTCGALYVGKVGEKLKPIVKKGDNILVPAGFVDVTFVERTAIVSNNGDVFFIMDANQPQVGFVFSRGGLYKYSSETKQLTILKQNTLRERVTSSGLQFDVDGTIFVGAYNSDGMSPRIPKLYRVNGGEELIASSSDGVSYLSSGIDFYSGKSIFTKTDRSSSVLLTKEVFEIDQSPKRILYAGAPPLGASSIGAFYANGLQSLSYYLGLIPNSWYEAYGIGLIDPLTKEPINFLKQGDLIGGKVVNHFNNTRDNLIASTPYNMIVDTNNGVFNVRPIVIKEIGYEQSTRRVSLRALAPNLSPIIRNFELYANGVRIFPDYPESFDVKVDKDGLTNISFIPPVTVEGDQEFGLTIVTLNIAPGRFTSVNKAKIKLPTTLIEFNFKSSSYLVDNGQEVLVEWTSNVPLTINNFETIPSAKTAVSICLTGKDGKCPPTTSGSYKVLVERNTQFSIRAVALNGKMLFEEFLVKVKPPVINLFGTEQKNDEDEFIPIRACGNAWIRGQNLAIYNEENSDGSEKLGGVSVIFEWSNPAKIFRATPGEIFLQVPCVLGNGEARMQIVREDGEESDGFITTIHPKPQQEDRK